MERCGVYDGRGRRTGRVVKRGARLASGEFYLVVHVWIRNEFFNYRDLKDLPG